MGDSEEYEQRENEQDIIKGFENEIAEKQNFDAMDFDGGDINDLYLDDNEYLFDDDLNEYDAEDENENEYEYEVDEADDNYLEDGNDFVGVHGDVGEYGAGFMWMVGILSFIGFCVFAFFMSIGVRRRRRKLSLAKMPEQQYLQQALEMTEESESE